MKSKISISCILIFLPMIFLGCAHLLGTNSHDEKAAMESRVFKNALAVINRDLYETETIEFENSKVFLFARKENGLPQEKIKAAILKYWPQWNQILKIPVKELAVIDFEAPWGGGPLGPYVVGVFSDNEISEGYQKMISQGTGWPPQASTKEYIDKYYAAFSDPEQAYIDDMVAHELGHAFFGFGLTEAPKEREEGWFYLGLGLVYDRLAWASLQKTPSPFFTASVDQWEDVFAKKSQVDQRLVRPNTKRDAELNLNRMQVYGHGKALVYLNALREHVGPEEFDQIVVRYISTPRVITYDDFLKTVPSKFRKGIRDLEKQFRVR